MEFSNPFTEYKSNLIAKESIILLDTNICMYRTLALVEPKIYNRDHLDRSINIIAFLTNNNLSCQIVISDIIESELKNNQVLFSEIRKFCVEKLGLTSRFRILSLSKSAEKSIIKFIEKKRIDLQMSKVIKNYPLQMARVKNFYLQYPDRLQTITIDKIRNIGKEIDKQRKLLQRPNYLPEENDLKLLCQAIECSQLYKQEVAILSNDRDFTEFKEEIFKEFKIKIICLEDYDRLVESH